MKNKKSNENKNFEPVFHRFDKWAIYNNHSEMGYAFPGNMRHRTILTVFASLFDIIRRSWFMIK